MRGYGQKIRTVDEGVEDLSGNDGSKTKEEIKEEAASEGGGDDLHVEKCDHKESYKNVEQLILGENPEMVSQT
jgi:hypothetical protein